MAANLPWPPILHAICMMSSDEVMGMTRSNANLLNVGSLVGFDPKHDIGALTPFGLHDWTAGALSERESLLGASKTTSSLVKRMKIFSRNSERENEECPSGKPASNRYCCSWCRPEWAQRPRKGDPPPETRMTMDIEMLSTQSFPGDRWLICGTRGGLRGDNI